MSETLQNEIHACKRDRMKIQGMVSIPNEIRTRYEFTYFEAIETRQGSTPVYTRIFLIGAPVLKHLKNEMDA